MDFNEHILSTRGKDFLDNLNKYKNIESKNALLLNEEKISKEDFLKMFPLLLPHPYVKNGFLYNKSDYQFGKMYLHDAGVYYLQDPSAMIVGSLVPLNEDDIILDMCAAPGGKSVQLSLNLGNKGIIISNDISYSRSLVLSSNIERMGRGNVLVCNDDFIKKSNRFTNFFSKIILDAPCSGSGMFRKEKKMEDDWSLDKVKRASEIQKDLITAAYNMLKPGGVLAYSTCSYSKEEDEDIIDYLLSNTDATLIDINMEEKYKSKYIKEAVLMYADDFGEGQFICLISKPGTLINKPLIVNNKDYNGLLNKLHLSGCIKCINNEFYLAPYNINLAELRIIRYFLKLGSYKGKDFIPDYHLSHYLTSKGSLSLNEEQLKKYLMGETLSYSSIEDGFHIVSFNNINIGYVKSIDNTLKNHYPKGLRIR